MYMDMIQKGIEKLKSGEFEAAAGIFANSFFADGNIRAGCYLAQIFYDRNISPKDSVHDAMAMILWQITALQGQASSMHRLGIAYQKSNSVSVKQKGVDYLKSAYDSGHESSAIVLGLISYMQNDYTNACSYFSKATALEKDKTAFYAFAESLIKKPNPDIRKGIEMLHISALEHHDVNASNLLCRLYTGKITPEVRENKQEMTRYLKLSANLNDPEACEKYGIELFCESGSREGHVQALSYLEKAANTLSVDGYLTIALIYWEDLGNESKAEYAFSQALHMDPNNASVNYKAGCFYYSIEQYDKAITYLEAALNIGNNDAAEILLEAYQRKNYIDKAINLAIYMEKNNLSPHNGSTNFDYLIGTLYVLGDCGFPADLSLGVDHLLRAAESGNVDAMNALGEVYICSDSIGKLNKNSVEQFLLSAYKSGSSHAAFLLGEYYIKQYQAVQSVQWLMLAYNEFGNKDAASMLADLYEQGYINGKKDKKNARLWRTRASE